MIRINDVTRHRRWATCCEPPPGRGAAAPLWLCCPAAADPGASALSWSPPLFGAAELTEPLDGDGAARTIALPTRFICGSSCSESRAVLPSPSARASSSSMSAKNFSSSEAMTRFKSTTELPSVNVIKNRTARGSTLMIGRIDDRSPNVS